VVWNGGRRTGETGVTGGDVQEEREVKKYKPEDEYNHKKNRLKCQMVGQVYKIMQQNTYVQ